MLEQVAYSAERGCQMNGRKTPEQLLHEANKAPSIRIRIFFNLQHFLSRLKKIPRPHVSVFNKEENVTPIKAQLTSRSVFPLPLLICRLSTVFFSDSETNETIPR